MPNNIPKGTQQGNLIPGRAAAFQHRCDSLTAVTVDGHQIRHLIHVRRLRPRPSGTTVSLSSGFERSFGPIRLLSLGRGRRGVIARRPQVPFCRGYNWILRLYLMRVRRSASAPHAKRQIVAQHPFPTRDVRPVDLETAEPPPQPVRDGRSETAKVIRDATCY